MAQNIPTKTLWNVTQSKEQEVLATMSAMMKWFNLYQLQDQTSPLKSIAFFSCLQCILLWMSLSLSVLQVTWTLPSKWSEHCACWTELSWFCARWEESSVRPWRWTGRWSATTSPSSPSSTSWTAWAPTPTEPCSKWGAVRSHIQNYY